MAKEVSLGRKAGGLLDQLWRNYCQQLEDCRARMTVKRVHQVRIALRRLEAGLLITQILLGGGAATKALANVKKNLQALSALRDAQVQGSRMKKMAGHGQDWRDLQDHWRRRERRLRRSGLRALGTGKLARRVSAARNRLGALPPNPSANWLMRARLERLLHQSRLRTLALLPSMKQNITGLHRARIAFRRYRYLVEALQPLRPEVAGGVVEELAHFQGLMGEIHDLDLLVARLDRSVRKGQIPARRIRAARTALNRRRTARVAAYLRSRENLTGLMAKS